MLSGLFACVQRSQGSRTGRTRWDLLAEEYVEAQAGGGMGQSNMGFKVRLSWHAAWLQRVGGHTTSLPSV